MPWHLLNCLANSSPRCAGHGHETAAHLYMSVLPQVQIRLGNFRTSASWLWRRNAGASRPQQLLLCQDRHADTMRRNLYAPVPNAHLVAVQHKRFVLHLARASVHASVASLRQRSSRFPTRSHARRVTSSAFGWCVNRSEFSWRPSIWTTQTSCCCLERWKHSKRIVHQVLEFRVILSDVQMCIKPTASHCTNANATSQDLQVTCNLRQPEKLTQRGHGAHAHSLRVTSCDSLTRNLHTPSTKPLQTGPPATPHLMPQYPNVATLFRNSMKAISACLRPEPADLTSSNRRPSAAQVSWWPSDLSVSM